MPTRTSLKLPPKSGQVFSVHLKYSPRYYTSEGRARSARGSCLEIANARFSFFSFLLSSSPSLFLSLSLSLSLSVLGFDQLLSVRLDWKGSKIISRS